MGLKYEIKKITSNINFFIALLMLLISSIVLFEFDISLSENMELSNPQIYVNVEMMSNSKPLEDIQSEIEIYTLIQREIDQGLELTQIEDRYSSSTVSKFFEVKEKYGDNYFKYALLSIKQISMNERVGEYQDYNLKVLEETRELIQRNTGNINSYENSFLKSVERMYTNLKDIDLQEPSNLSVEAYVSSNYREVITLFFILFLVYNLLINDFESDMEDVLTLSSSGKKRLSYNKLLTLGFFMILFVLLNEIVIILYSIIKYGNFDWFINIQNFNILIASPYNLTVFQLVFISLLIKVLNGLIISFLIFSLMSIFENKNIGIILSIALMGFSIFMYYSVHDSSLLRNFKYINLFGLGKAFIMIKNFVYLNFKVIYSSWVVSSLVVSVVLLPLLVLLSHYLFVNFNGVFTLKLSRKGRRKRIFETSSLFKHEFIKSFIMEGNLIVLTLTLIVSICFVYNTSTIETSNYNSSIFNYIDKHGGLIDDELIAYFEHEENRYSRIKTEHDLIVSKYNNGEISDDQYQSHLVEYLPLSQEMTVFNSVLIRLNRSHDYLINTQGYENITAQYNYKNDHSIAIVLMILLILIISNFFAIDRKESEDTIYDVTKQGYKNRSIMKLLLTIIITVVTVIYIYSIYYFIVSNKYGLNYNHIQMANIVNLEVNSIGLNNNPNLLKLSISNYLILIHITRLIGYLFIALVSLIVSKLVRSRAMVILILCFIFVIPSVLFLLGFDAFYFISIFDLISGNMYFRLNGGIVKLVFIASINLMMILLLIINLNQNSD